MPKQGSQLHTDVVDEERLVRNAKRDLRQFNALYQLYVQPVYRYLYSRIGSQAAAEDATAQTFLAALEGLAGYRHEGHFAAWLFAIARRKSADHFRGSSRIADLAETIPSGDEDMLQHVVRRDQMDALRQKLTGLSAGEQELLRLRFAAELSFAEIARLLDRNEDAVKKSLYRLLDRLQEQMEGSHE
jgi:RNA polymerase sigma-70 factor (ECF subfamily)